MKATTQQPQHSDELARRFQQEYLQHRRGLFAFVFVLVGNRSDAEDLFQEACTVMWRKFDHFQPGTSFRAWAKQICRHVVMDYRKRRRRRRVVDLDEQTIELLIGQVESMQDQFDDRVEVLKQCVEKLSYRDHELVEMAYHRSLTIRQVAAECRVSVQRIYRRLGDIHQALLFCLRRTLAERGMSL